MKITETKLKGCFICEPLVFPDFRGAFFESFRRQELENVLGYKVNFVQENRSISRKGVLRGLHFQKGKHSQAKLVSVLRGEVIDVIVDLRLNSKTYGEYLKIRLSEYNKKLLFIPKGMAHGFLALEEDTIFVYKCDSYYQPNAEGGIIYNDKDLNISWESSEKDLILSEKDLVLPKFSELAQ